MPPITYRCYIDIIHNLSWALENRRIGWRKIKKGKKNGNLTWKK